MLNDKDQVVLLVENLVRLDKRIYTYLEHYQLLRPLTNKQSRIVNHDI